MTVLPSTIDEMTASSFGNDDTKPPQDREFEMPKDFVPPPPNREVGKLLIITVYCKLRIKIYCNKCSTSYHLVYANSHTLIVMIYLHILFILCAYNIMNVKHIICTISMHIICTISYVPK